MKSLVEKSDWRLYHSSFKKESNKIISYIQEKYVLEKCPQLFLVHLTTENEKEYLHFNVGFFIEDGKGIIIRDLELKICPELFIQFDEEIGINGCQHIADVFDYFDKKRVIFLQINYKSDNNKIYSFTELNASGVIDDIGKTYNDFSDITHLNKADVPEEFLKQTYSVVGINYYVTHSSQEINCILFAESKNEYDANAIKILRWFPMSKNKKKGPFFTELYAYGYISRNENYKLHNFMCENNSRFLFGTVKGNKVTIDGNFADYGKNNTAYFLPQFIIKYIK